MQKNYVIFTSKLDNDQSSLETFLIKSKTNKKWGATDFVSETKRCGKQADFEKLASVNQYDLRGFKLKISKMNQRRLTILVIFCDSVALFSKSKCCQLFYKT